MTSTASTNRASEMWNNSAQVHSQSEKTHYGYQYPVVPNAYEYHNNFYAQNCEYPSDYNRVPNINNPLNKVVKTEPNWQNYPIHYANNSHDQANIDMINRWRQMNTYPQQYENYGYQPGMQAIANRAAIDIKGEDTRSVDSPGQCSLPETSYGSPQNSSNAVKSPSGEERDSPNLRALLSKPNIKRMQESYGKYDKFYTHEMLQQMNYCANDIDNWGKNNETRAPNDGNVHQFHGEYNTNLDTHTKVKTKRSVGGAPVQSESANSVEESTENCQDLTRVDAGGDNEDYADNKMAIASEVQGFYPWMKSVNGIFLKLILYIVFLN